MGKFTSQFFEADALMQFTTKIQTYWADKYPGVEHALTQHELKQLMWLQVNSTTTPQLSVVSLKNDLNYEIKRALARLAGFQLLMTNAENAYAAFANIWKASADLLDKNSFAVLANKLQILSETERAALRLTCFFTLSDLAKSRLKDKDISYTNDSEIFLSEMSLLSTETLKRLFPLFRSELINDGVITTLQLAYWPGAHARHFYFLEGKNLGPSIQILKDQHPQATTVWEMRWWLNLFGFNPNQAVTQILYNQWEPLFTDLNQNPNTALQHHFERIMTKMLNELTIPTDFTDADKKWVAHLAWFYTKGVLTIDERQGMVDSYARLKATPIAPSVLQNYENFLSSPSAPTPTYTPALFTRVYEVIKNNIETFSSLLQQNDFAPNVTSAAAAAFYFSSQILNEVYAQANTGVLVSCYLLTQPPKDGESDQLEHLLTQWLMNKLDLTVAIDSKGNVTADAAAATLTSTYKAMHV